MKITILRSILISSAILIAIAFLFYLRMIPALEKTDEFVFDQAFNYRITKETISNGSVPTIDHLSTYPEGKNIRAFIPIGMYNLCAMFYRAINVFGRVDLNRAILFFCSICGALITIPIYFISNEIYKNRFIAYLSAVLGGIMPAFLHRTFCYWYRYEVPGTLFLFFSLLFFLKTFTCKDTKKIYIYSALTPVFLYLSLYIWRLSALFLIVYFMTFFYLWARNKKFPMAWWKGGAIILGLSFIAVKLAPGFAGHTLAGSYGSFPKALIETVLYNLGFEKNLSEFTRLIYYNEELGRVSLLNMFNMTFMSLSAFFVIVFFVRYFTYTVKKDRDAGKDILFVFLTFFLTLTFIFARNKIVLGPLAALSLGESVSLAFRQKDAIKKIALCLTAAILIKTGYDAYKLAATRYPVNTSLRPNLKLILDFINHRTPKDSVILCYWADGYPIQTYCDRATITDGLFESPEIVKRILEESRIYYSYNEDDMFAFCIKYGATHLLVPFNRKISYADYAGVEYKKYFQKSGPTAMGQITVLYKLLFQPSTSSRFRFLYGNKEYILYSLKD